MIAYWYYILAISIPLIFVPLALWLNKKLDGKLTYFFKAVSLTVGIVLVFRYMLGTDAIQDIYALTNTPFASKGLTF